MLYKGIHEGVPAYVYAPLKHKRIVKGRSRDGSIDKLDLLFHIRYARHFRAQVRKFCSFISTLSLIFAMCRDKLESELREMPWSYEGKKSLPGVNQTMWDYYQNYWLPFGELLTDIEREGIKV